MSDFREFIEKAEKEVYEYFEHCPLCYAENSMQINWSFSKDTLTCSNCGAKWHINHGMAGFHWAKLIRVNAEGKGVELLGKKNDPFFWKQMALSGVRLAEETSNQSREERAKEEPPQQPAIEEEAKQEPATIEEEKPWWWNPLKYFLHGISFSVLLLVLAFAWGLVLGMLIIFGSFIGLIIGFFVLFFLIGGLNTFLTDVIWSITVKAEWMSLLGHGLLLFIALLIASIPAVFVNLAAPNLATSVVAFIVYAFIDGFIAKKVGEYFEEEYEEGY